MSIRLAALVPLLLLLGSATGCDGEAEQLRLNDLTPNELDFVTRFLILERARAVALVDPDRGEALLDSLTADWGDTSQAAVSANLPADPLRAAALYELLGRVLVAEQDSLLQAPLPRRLTDPLPDPLPAPTSEAP